jgi:hypothetical protein
LVTQAKQYALDLLCVFGDVENFALKLYLNIVCFNDTRDNGCNTWRAHCVMWGQNADSLHGTFRGIWGTG